MKVERYILSYVISVLGGLAFQIMKLPLPWILGPVTFLLFYKLTTKYKTEASLKLRNVSFGLLGIQIGGTFTTHTFANVTPYLLPYTILTLTLIFVSLLNAYLITKWIKIDAKTSMLGSVPGGLSAMLALSDSLSGNTVLVTILHTIRLVTVLFAIPFVATEFFGQSSQGNIAQPPEPNGEWYTIAIYLTSIIVGYYLQKRIPASLVIVPMLIVGGCETAGLPLFEVPNIIFVFAQLCLGVYLGNSVSIIDLWKAGSYCLYYFALSIFLIGISFGFGYLLSIWTGMSLPTAILSLAPGGLIEMALTAKEAGGDPSIVSSLQIIRLLVIVLLIPLVLPWLVFKLTKGASAHS
ncbi:AbrB family transcriptional regulator [Thalassobacillus pellis]|uniref:AbrB family transcriptional regulator n=1 Tax=Thalassobacillus pellis TaxID=748008 RepID=UPI001961B55A|nr:AbrB family transcriptional regulator [Thalassobacillus pellis]MBM7552543.1 membrane AbrB-like protein [Thalassobacillus pellis]